jgi:hypothetical protein
MKKGLLYRARIPSRMIILIIPFLFLFVTNLFCDELFDLCYDAQLLRNGKIFFLRYRYPTLDPVLKTYEIHVFDPLTGNVSFLQKYAEQLYIPPVISRNRSTICYHSLIEGTDYLVTYNLEKGVSTRLRFDTGGYFLGLGIDYDNDTVVSNIKRGENKQALYLISNRESSIRRILNGTDFTEVGFLYNGNPYFVEILKNRQVLGFIAKPTRKVHIIAEGFEYVQKALNGDAILYSKAHDLYLYRVFANESIVLTRNFDKQLTHPLYSADGSTCVIIEPHSIYIVNIPSGDILYFLSIDTEGATFYLTDFIFYMAKDGKVFFLEHKKPGQILQELFEHSSSPALISVSQNDRYLLFLSEQRNEVMIYDRTHERKQRVKFPFAIEKIIYPEHEERFYIISKTLHPEKLIPVRELYLYDFKNELLTAISTASETDVAPYLRNE